MTEIRDQLISKSIRWCWNPACGYALAISKTICDKCCWTSNGPPQEVTSPLMSPTGKAYAGEVKARAIATERNREMNGVETKYEAFLKLEKHHGRVAFYGYECIKLRLSDTSLWIPDFMVVDQDGYIRMVDTKAYWKTIDGPGIRPDALEKLKHAGELYPIFTVVATWFHEGQWHERQF